MKKNPAVLSIIIASILLALVGGWFLGKRSARINFLRSATPMDKLKATIQLIEENYVDSVDTDKLILDLIPDLMNQLDPHSTFLTPEQRKQERESIEGFFYGIGVTFNMIKDTAIIVNVTPNGPSDLAGLRAGDRILTVNNQPITGGDIPADSVRSLLKGEKGSMVQLGIRSRKEQTERLVNVRRGVVNMPQIDAAFMVNDSLGYIRIPSFAMNTHNEFMQKVAYLEAKGMKGLILDLRDNRGGLLQPALLISNEILPAQSLIIYTEGAHHPRNDVYSDGTGLLQRLPIYVLINEMSASSSEIVSGALQDNDAAIIIGRRSFGKGLVQKPFEYYDGSSVHLTVARYHTASGRSLQRDYKLGGSEEYTNDWMERYSRGEMFSADSIKIDSERLYLTKGGRAVYGGGGISPDIFVARDTVGITSYYVEVLNKGVAQLFAFEYADRYRDILIRLGSAEKCYQFLKHQGLVWQMAEYANKKGVRPKNYLIYLSQDQLNRVLFPLIIDYIYGQDSAWMVRGYTDSMIQMATQLYDNGIIKPHDIPQDKRLLPDTLIVETNKDSIPESYAD